MIRPDQTGARDADESPVLISAKSAEQIGQNEDCLFRSSAPSVRVVEENPNGQDGERLSVGVTLRLCGVGLAGLIRMSVDCCSQRLRLADDDANVVW